MNFIKHSCTLRPLFTRNSGHSGAQSKCPTKPVARIAALLRLPPAILPKLKSPAAEPGFDLFKEACCLPIRLPFINYRRRERGRSFLQIVAHNLKLAANIDHMRDGTSNAPPEPRPPPIVPEHGSGGFVRQRGSPI